MNRASFLPVPHVFNLNMACMPIAHAYDQAIYLVGSSLERRDYRDVDLRLILDDDDFGRRFPRGGGQRDALWSLTCAAISLYVEKHTALPIDFQIQRRTEANKEFPGRRHAVGLFFTNSQPADAPESPEPPNHAVLARLAYEAYIRSSGGLNYRSDPCPAWDDLPEAIRGHWRAAVAEVRP